jgi:hypothetical protein
LGYDVALRAARPLRWQILEAVTVGDILDVLRRRWLIALLLLAGAVVALHAAAQYPPVYSSRVEVRFLPPQTSRNPNSLEFTTGGVIATAGLVARTLTAASEEPPSATTVLLHDRGIREGTSVVVPNSGGQWAANFEDPILDVQAVGASPEDVSALRDDRVAAIKAELARLQADVPTKLRITTATTPVDPMVEAKQGSPHRALLALTVLLGGLGLWLLAIVDRALTRARRRRAVGSGLVARWFRRHRGPRLAPWRAVTPADG